MDAFRTSSEEYTTEYIENLPEGKRAELIDGIVYDMSAPGTLHQRIVMRISQKLANYIDENGGKCEVFPAPFAVYLAENNKNYLEPDITVICDPDKIDEKGCHGAPDMIIEVTSDSTYKRDMGIKLFKYRDAGVREYWVINPKLRVTTVNIFDEKLGEDNIAQYSFDEEVSPAIYPGLKIRLSDHV